MRCDDDKALLEKMDFVEEESQLDGEIAEYDALVVEAYKLESTVSKLALAMDKATSISTLKVANQTLSKPKTMRGFGVIQQLVSFELSDGQAVSIIFNVSDSEANASAKMTKDDLLVAWKYKLNSRDITAAVQPNATQNVSLNMIASRIMGLADANSEKFVAAQKKKDAMQTELANTNQQVKDLQGQEQALLQEIADLQKQLDEKAKNGRIKDEQEVLSDKTGKTVYAQFFEDDEKVWILKSHRYFSPGSGVFNPFGVTTITGAERIKRFKTKEEAEKWAVENGYKVAGKEIPAHPKDVVQSAPQDRPTDYRTNLANARAVAESLGIETKGKKLSRLLREIDIFDEKEVKKELLSEFKALASRLVLPKGYVFDLSDAEKSIDDITRWVSPMIKQKGAFDFNKIRIELRAVASINEYEGGVYISDYVFFYTEDKKAKAELDKLNYPNDGNINASEPKTPKATVEKMEQFLIKAVFPKIEYLKVVNGTELDPSKLSELGIANIESIGSENLYFEKDGKYYISKVGNTKNYALGEWDFAKYPDGKPVNEPVVQTGARYESPKELFLKKANKAYKDLEDNGLKGFAKKVTAIIEDVYNNAEKVDAADKRLEGVVFESKNPLISGEWRDLATGKSYFFENMEYGEVIDTRKEGRRNVIDPWRTTDGEYFESLREAKAHELETYAKQRLIDDGFMQGVKTKDKPQPVSEPSKPLSDIVIKALLSQDSEAWYTDDYGDVKSIYSADERDGFFIRISDKSKQVDLTYTDWETDQKQNETFVADTISPDQVIDRIKAFITKYEQNSVELSPVQPISEPPMTNPDRDYLQSIIDGKADLSNADEIEAKLTDINERLDADLEPLFEQAAEAFAQYGIAQAAMN